jgi:protein SCO1/2
LTELHRTATAALLLVVAPTAHGTLDPGSATAPRSEFVAPPAGTYRLQRIQSTSDAELLDGSNRVQHLSRFMHGKVTLLTFFYTYCVDPLGCPFAHMTLAGLRARLLMEPRLASAVRFVNVSLDPTTDTPAAITQYAAQFATDSVFEWRFLTARSVSTLLPVLEDFGQDVSVEMDERGRPTRTLHHMLKVFLIDGKGIVREIYSLAYLQPDVMFNDIQTLFMEDSRAILPPAGMGPAGETKHRREHEADKSQWRGRFSEHHQADSRAGGLERRDPRSLIKLHDERDLRHNSHRLFNHAHHAA